MITECLSVFSSNAREHRPEKLRIRIFLNYKWHRLHWTYLAKLSRRSDWGSRNWNTSRVSIIFTGRLNFHYFYFSSVITSLWLHKYVSVLHHTIDFCYVIYLRRILTHAHAASFKKTRFCEINIFLVLKNNPIF